jgi:hypothetical protein
MYRHIQILLWDDTRRHPVARNRLASPSWLFPATSQEWRQWDVDYCLWQAHMSQERDTELLKPTPAIEYTV